MAQEQTNVSFKRKYRWIIEGDLPGGKLPPYFCKVTARPTLNIDDKKWETIAVTLFEFDLNDATLWKIIETSSILDAMPAVAPPEKLGNFKITLYDGWGFPLEEWIITEAYFCKVVREELDHTSTSCFGVELTICYKNISWKYLYKPKLTMCPNC